MSSDERTERRRLMRAPWSRENPTLGTAQRWELRSPIFRALPAVVKHLAVADWTTGFTADELDCDKSDAQILGRTIAIDEEARRREVCGARRVSLTLSWPEHGRIVRWLIAYERGKFYAERVLGSAP